MFENKVVVVTGGSRGIGRAIALEFGRREAKVIINYKSDEEAANKVHNEIADSGGEAAIFQADVGEIDQAQALITFAVETFGDLQILVNNAGITRDTLILKMSESQWDDVLRTNLKATFNCSKSAVKHMMRKRYGRIINITSVSGLMGNAGQTNYSASKAGQIGFTKALAREVASRNITVNAVAPGFIETEIWSSVPGDMLDDLIQLIPLGRVGQPEEVAKVVAFLASEDAAYITGHILSIDGGMAMF